MATHIHVHLKDGAREAMQLEEKAEREINRISEKVRALAKHAAAGSSSENKRSEEQLAAIVSALARA